MLTRIITLCAVSTTLAIPGCGKEEQQSSTNTGTPVVTNAAWVLDAEPADAKGVADAKLTAAEGEEITIHGKIGGRKDPLSADSAIFVIMDIAIPSCADNPGDMCTTPWDYCCETPDTITANNASIMLVDDEGKAMALNLRDYGFDELDEIVVVGTVRPRPSEAVLAINATGIYKVGG